MRNITAYSWYGNHFTSITAYGVLGVRVEVQVSKREFHTHIHLDLVRVKFLSCIKKKMGNVRIKKTFQFSA